MDNKIIFLLILYTVIAFIIVRNNSGKTELLLCFLNFFTICLLLYRLELINSFKQYFILHGDKSNSILFIEQVLPKVLLLYSIFIIFHILLIYNNDINYSYINVILPLLLLFLIKWSSPIQVIGMSYVTFRLSLLASEYRARTIKLPGICSYLNYTSYVPITFVGPITSFRFFNESINDRIPLSDTWLPSIFRILLGATKVLVLANLFRQLSFSVFWNDIGPHTVFDFVISSIAYYLFLYANFSGACDIVIAASNLIGFRIQENFNRPFQARNINEFWANWHITLSETMKATIYHPLSRLIINKFGQRYINTAIILSTIVIFIVIGMWHGLQSNFILFGCIHGIAAVTVFTYTKFIKSRKNRLKLYKQNIFIKYCSTVLTFMFVSLSLSLFENTLDEIVTHFDKIQSLF
jgi:D-alanyl-lipoteichoic acid acyltransferase DltB (MBOAT superfamily)